MPKKPFTDSAALQFMPPTGNDAAPAKPTSKQPEKEYKHPEPEERVYPPPSSFQVQAEADHWEPRTRRVHLIMKPSVYSGINHMARKNRQSFNHFVETLLEAVLAEAKRGEAKDQGKG